ncbi:hypothetical protein NBG4_210033 [Candidatus Sulfobium mesophilum]|uniref:Uncharacterized protein n=1 Tax=Candidatus Sulfobium mesophilum TaxID=2016548 RepID=A0A2U3QG38_9BACT|nr:hypothetical protein NBG4_210033 [Candidatus Sulfobium mesophilum]
MPHLIILFLSSASLNPLRVFSFYAMSTKFFCTEIKAGLIVPLGLMRVLVVEYGEYLADEVEQNKRHDEDSDGAKKPFFKCFQVVRDYREVIMHVAGEGQ